MRTKSLFIVCIAVIATSFAQEKKSKADILFYGYDYKNAIVAYQKEMSVAPLKNGQLLNMADAYYKIGDFNNATKIYLEVHKKDSTVSGHRYNKMLQSLAKTSTKERVMAFLNTKRESFSNEILENADFNYDLLTDNTVDQNFQVFNLAGNSPQTDFAPAFYKDRLLVSSGRGQANKDDYKPSGESYLDIYIGRIDADGNVLSVNPFTQIPDSKFHKATPYFSEELDRLFYVLSNTEDGELLYDENGKNSLAIAVSDTNGDLGYLLKDLSTSFYYPFYDAKPSKLYFSANFSDSYGGTDIYYVYTINGQIMSEPKNLGPIVNSPGNEIAPYIYENSLYFSSDIFYGLGGMDIYKANMFSDGTFGIPVNLGKGINSVADDFSLILRKNKDQGLLGYFSSNRSGGKGKDDVYGFQVDKEIGLKTLTLRGRVSNLNSNSGILKAKVAVVGSNDVLLKEQYTDEKGNFRIEIPWREQVSVKASKERYSEYTMEYSESEDGRAPSINMGLSYLDDLLVEKEGKKVVKLQNFYFDKGKTTITPLIQVELDKVVNALKSFPHLTIAIESHTNSKGTASVNKRLSQNRANAIRSYLIKKGLPADSIGETVGFGEEQLTNNCTDGVFCLDFLHKQNERTYIVVTNSNEL